MRSIHSATPRTPPVQPIHGTETQGTEPPPPLDHLVLRLQKLSRDEVESLGLRSSFRVFVLEGTVPDETRCEGLIAECIALAETGILEELLIRLPATPEHLHIDFKVDHLKCKAPPWSDGLIPRESPSGLSYDGLKVLFEFILGPANDTLNRLTLTNYCLYRTEQDDSLQILGKALASNTSLTTLELKTCQLTSDDVGQLSVHLAANTTLQVLDLSDNDFDDGVGWALKLLLQQSTSITSLDLSRNSIDSEDLSHLVAGLKDNPTLKRLDLSLCELGPDANQSLAELLQLNTLAELALRQNDLADDSVSFSTLADALPPASALIRLDLSDNMISNQAMENLCSRLLGHSTLETLTLSNNLVGSDEAWALATLLKHNTSLSSLTLNACAIDDVAAELIFSALPSNERLRTLRLCGNKFTFPPPGQGAPYQQDIAACFAGNKGLKTLDLSSNEQLSTGCQTIADILRASTSLRTLHLGFCGINDAGVGTLAPALDGPIPLQILDLVGNHDISDAGLCAIAGTLPGNQGLTKLRLLERPLSHPVVQAFVKALKSNFTLQSLPPLSRMPSGYAELLFELDQNARFADPQERLGRMNRVIRFFQIGNFYLSPEVGFAIWMKLEQSKQGLEFTDTLRLVSRELADRLDTPETS